MKGIGGASFCLLKSDLKEYIGWLVVGEKVRLRKSDALSYQVTIRPLTRVGRNDPCPCGSGKKYKKCCLSKFKLPSPEEIVSLLEKQRKQRPEPHLDFVESLVVKDYRLRIIWSRIYRRPAEETFHEFIMLILQLTFSDAWYKHQISLPNNERHIIVRWLSSYEQWSRAMFTDENKCGENKWRAIPSGEVLALHQLAYDIYCLQTIRKLPRALIERLRNAREFQGARYEVAVAAIIARAGFEIDFLDKKEKGRKHCEFLAKHKRTGEMIGIEAKSRRRKGILNEDGSFDSEGRVSGEVSNLLSDAIKQSPKNLPYLIFIDLNIPPTPDIPIDQKHWIGDIKLTLNKVSGTSSKEYPDVFNALFLTNFSYYYAGNTGEAPPGESLFVVPRFAKTPIHSVKVLEDIAISVDRYSVIPEEV